mgnify:CR=1 FL=1
MDKYNSKQAEAKIKKFWEKEKIYKFNGKSENVYSIDTPPPYISGRMHIGHAFSYSQQDFIARFRRMLQGNLFYPFGTDDNGLPTERFIEKTNNVSSKSMSRAEFIELCLKTLKKFTPECVNDFKILGISCDYDIYYSTIDKLSQKVSQKSFIDLYKKKEIYKKDFPTFFCVRCQTPFAQAELEDKTETSLFSTLKFKVDDKDLLIATTRVELLPACVGVFVNPDDKRYKHLIGKKARVPLFNFEVPILGDNSADVEKGTGAMMVCSYGDKYDVEAINRHKLKPKIIITKNGKLNVAGYELSIKDARKKILEDLEKRGLIKEQKKIEHVVNVHDKCGTEVEFLPVKQWFIKILDKKQKLIEQGRKIKWQPEFMRKRYENWTNGLEWDWSISRDRHFGVPIPVWECSKCGSVILPDEKELPVDPMQMHKKCKCGNIATPETNVLDTWATSSLTPQIASSLVDNKIRIPFSLRPQAHDIIRTWAFYTITKSYLHENKIPWKDIMVSGFVTLGGEKMSKSKGNVVDPIKVMEQYSADCLRYWAASSKLGEDLDYSEKELIAGKKFVNKLFNASKFAFMFLKHKPEKCKLEIIDNWILSKLQILIDESTKSFLDYEYQKSKAETDKFFWSLFCDNYLEIIKNRLYNGSEKEKKSAEYALYNVLLNLLKLFAPITPYITEEIYQECFKKYEKEKSIHLAKWPEADKKMIDKKALEIGDLFIEILAKVRQAKSEAKKSMKTPIVLELDENDYKLLESVLKDLEAVTNSKDIELGGFRVEFE